MRNIFNLIQFTMRKVFKINLLITSRDNISVQVRKYCEFKFKVFRSDYPFFKSLIILKKLCETRKKENQCKALY